MILLPGRIITWLIISPIISMSFIRFMKMNFHFPLIAVIDIYKSEILKPFCAQNRFYFEFFFSFFSAIFYLFIYFYIL